VKPVGFAEFSCEHNCREVFKRDANCLRFEMVGKQHFIAQIIADEIARRGVVVLG